MAIIWNSLSGPYFLCNGTFYILQGISEVTVQKAGEIVNKLLTNGGFIETLSQHVREITEDSVLISSPLPL